ncbi:PLP-dependent transferase [Corynespora cassiicola Philippines]|uniref:PLP-dependent transferase n=1 Tax=Corynespora cassiicola Philippines TaxID=1448308 RepID=A0A2T2N8P3_CORCC|nr:PLP-dependent transferase [Corynespora cassiicola Philippines]
MATNPSGLWRHLLAVQVYGANTGVGKTVFSTLLGAHFARRPKWDVQYIKPVSTGPLDEADEQYVRRYARAPVRTIFQYQDPVSPHVAARSSVYPGDDHLNSQIATILNDYAQKLSIGNSGKGLGILETAGGVLSPSPSGVPQADAYRPLRLPVVLVGDHRLGGISSTISAAESLTVRGYDIEAVICFDDKGKYENAAYLKDYFDKINIKTFELPWIPNLEGCTELEEKNLMQSYYENQSQNGPIKDVGTHLVDRNSDRNTILGSLATRTHKSIWHPFTQHKTVEKPQDILVFDSAHGDFFQVLKTEVETKEELSRLYPAFDGSASWWTQGLGHGNSQLALATAYAAGRYGHVMFAGATHQPALYLAEELLEKLNNPRLTKCFYTDDGSTAVEVAIKMGLRAACKKYDWDGSKHEIGVLGLKGSYHGDTIGAMDASEPCVYNKKVDWYRGRGYWFDYPTVKMHKGKWVVEPPAGMESDFGPTRSFETLGEVLDFGSRVESPQYANYIKSVLDRLVGQEKRQFGALLMEPVILGAGGMILVDPLFQQTLVKVVREYNFGASESVEQSDAKAWSGLPVIFDEVFTGLYRLGRPSAASFLQVDPDISVHAKLLTGGLLPLSVTLASDSIFQAFWGDEKAEALLHGHSYTAHPIGCHVARKSLMDMEKLSASEKWEGYRQSWKNGVEAPEGAKTNKDKTWSMWSKGFVEKISHHARVDGVIAIGSVLAVSLRDNAGSGYTSTVSIGLRDALLKDAREGEPRVHSRILGNVIYLMASMTSEPAHLKAIEEVFMSKLDSAL